MKAPLISVVMSVYKEPIEWLQLAINSVLNQTLADFEFIIVCDNPDYKEGITLLEEYANIDNRIRLIFNQENIGLTKSLNKGLAMAQGEYIARMDADDISVKNRFEIEVDYLKNHPEVDVCGSKKRAFGNVNIFTKKVNTELPLSNDDIKVSMFFVNCMVHPSVMMKRIICGKEVSYNEDYRISQDYILWHELLNAGAVINNIDKVLLNYRVSGSQISSSNIAQKRVCDTIQEELLKDLYPIIKEEEIRMHSEITSLIKSEISIEDKINYLTKLSTLLKARYKNHSYIEYLVSYCALKNCIANDNPTYYLKKHCGIKRDLMKSGFWRLLVKYYCAKISHRK